jgi:peptide chain release factor 1
MSHTSGQRKRERIYSLTKKDFKVQTFRGSGAGGQHRNKRDTCVRIVHPDSGAYGESCDERSQNQNRKIAFRRLLSHPKFRIWHTRKVAEYDRGKTLEQEVAESMRSENLRFENKDENGRWTEEEL